MNYTYKVHDNIDVTELSQVFKASGIRRPVDDLDRLQKMIEMADIVITARADNKVIGVARAITDFSYCCYLSDLAVDKNHQKAGIGKNLIQLLQDEIGEEVSLLLLSAPEAMEYYPKIGFTSINNGFSIPRKK
ncbi:MULTISPECIES: GNAT family N-acetyltransferase [Bacillaceae]|uniref:GNAT family N-acetyltransferase n=1 Tax=Bacillaceae TaxID=186817 RepID=UPI000BFC92E4|nr:MULTISPECIES: GNAT family N-acetyltransferase [Bacillaceae]PGT81874.1 GNAT family N-acetyltransferase [Bacillus sp. AFS040349]UGB30197.1 GNAT family N-acetyltransferase [Metabacillus sp. B2-18]